ncbi:MAG: PTS system mannose/fructose/sorbose family transporter subunit IID, partial [Anaerolineae bacterium]
VLGNFIMGALVVQFVSLSTSVGLLIGGTAFELQPIIDRFMPNLLPLLLVLLIWWLLTKKDVSPTTIMIVMILVGVLGSYPLWPGINAETGEAIKVGFF